MRTPPLDGYLGTDGRITSGAAPEMVDAGYRLEISDAPLLHRGLGLADMAHLEALTDLGVIPRATARMILREILDLFDTDPADFPYDARYGDAYNSRERELDRRLGRAAGWLHTGRTRREAGRIAFRIALRAKLLGLHRAAADFTTALTDQAERYADCVWADHTYLQPAQPSTFGHYLGSFAEESTRSLGRISSAFELMNQSPAGAGGVGGSRVPFDRGRLAKTLGFDIPGPHIRDAMWAVDVCADVAMASTQSTITADRFAEDLEIFASPAFGYVELDASLCRASVLLPQKRNPYTLAVIRAGANHLIGAATGVLASGRTPSARTDNWLHTYGDVASMVDRAQSLLRLAGKVAETLVADRMRMGAAAAANFTSAADLAEELVLREGLDYRSAYRAVGRAVAEGIASGEEYFTFERVSSALRAVSDRELTWQPDELQQAIDPLQIVDSRDALGGSGPRAVRAHCADVRERLRVAEAWRVAAERRIQDAESGVVERAVAETANSA